MQKLTQPLVDSLSPDGRDRVIFDSQQPGFALRVTPSGTKIYVAQASVAGRKRRLTVGINPDKTLAKARADEVIE
jgi:hypothetical protein